jgi:hypothetical protein
MLPKRRFAVIIDEAHSSQGGETATDLKEVLGGEDLREEAQRRAAEENLENMEELFRSMAKRGRQANLSFSLLRLRRSIRRWRYSVVRGSRRTAIRCARQLRKSSSWTC